MYRNPESVEVLDANGELEGYALVDYNKHQIDSVRVGDTRLITPVACCRTCAWNMVEETFINYNRYYVLKVNANA